MLCCCSKTFFAQTKKIDSLLSVLQNANEDTIKVKTLSILSEQFEQSAKYAESRKYADDALLLAEKLGYKKGIANVRINIGNIDNDQGNYAEALKNHLAALKIFKEIGNKMGARLLL
jgi:tetratricopeptide (TPR) repeat protein